MTRRSIARGPRVRASVEPASPRRAVASRSLRPRAPRQAVALALALALVRVQWDLNRVEPPRPKRRRELLERARRVVRHAESPDPAVVPLALEPREMLPPRNEVVHLLDLDASEPLDLAPELLAALLHRARPDLRRDIRCIAPARERGAERRFRAAVHRRGIDHATAGIERRSDDVRGGVGVTVERIPRSEADDRPQPPFRDHPASECARRPAANAAAKNHASSSGPRPMDASGSPAHASRQPETSILLTEAPTGSSIGHPAGQATLQQPPQRSSTAWAWCETPR